MPPRTDLNDRLLNLAEFYIGVLEAGGANRGPMVEQFQKAVDGKAQGEPWCMAFAQFCIAKVMEVHGGRSRVFKTEHCLTAWQKSEPAARIVKPEPGDLVIWQHGNGPSGHVGIVKNAVWTTPDSSGLWTVEGNTGPGGGIVREGDGVYNRWRDCIRPGDKVGDMLLLGYLRAF